MAIRYAPMYMECGGDYVLAIFRSYMSRNDALRFLSSTGFRFAPAILRVETSNLLNLIAYRVCCPTYTLLKVDPEHGDYAFFDEKSFDSRTEAEDYLIEVGACSRGAALLKLDEVAMYNLIFNWKIKK